MMKTNLKYLSVFIIVMMLILNETSQAQVAKMSFSSAYNVLNTGSKNSTSVTSSKSSALAINNSASYSKNVKVGYGIPIEIVLEYAIVKSNLSSDMASDPATYNSSSDEVQQAFVNLAYGDF